MLLIVSTKYHYSIFRYLFSSSKYSWSPSIINIKFDSLPSFLLLL